MIRGELGQIDLVDFEPPGLPDRSCMLETWRFFTAMSRGAGVKIAPDTLVTYILFGMSQNCDTIWSISKLAQA